MKEEYLEVYFTNPYYSDNRWRAFISDTYPVIKDKIIYKVKIKLPKELVNMEELEVSEVIKVK